MFLAHLAEGLAHAHSRGLAHRDLKPANVLVADDGRPMILDFNLSGPSAGAEGPVGGTLPYMAPEQLLLFAGKDGGAADARSDVFAFGLVMQEILGGSPPPCGGDLPTTLRDRLRPFPPARKRLSGVEPALAAILDKCLRIDPSERYADAKPLADDLNRHALDFPLGHAVNPPGDCLRKWGRRNRVSVSGGVVASVLGLMGLICLVGWTVYAGRVAALEACAQADAFVHEGPRLIGEIASTGPGEPGFADALDSADRWLARFPAAELDCLDAGRRAEVERQARRLSFAAAHAHLAIAETRRPDAEEHRTKAQKLAESAGQGPGLFRLTRRAEDARCPVDDLAWKMLEGDGETADDSDTLILLAYEAMTGRNHDLAADFLERVIRAEPANYPAWAMLAACRTALGDDLRAERAYTAAMSLNPDGERLLIERGLSRGRLSRHAEAIADFERAASLNPDSADDKFCVGWCHERLGRPAEAVTTYTAALKLAPNESRILWRRHITWAKIGKPDEAAADKKAFLAVEPKSARDWVLRCVARAEEDPTGALSDLDRALDLDPGYLPAYEHRVYLLSECLNRLREAKATASRYIGRYPRQPKMLAARAAIHARLGETEAALADCRMCLEICPESSSVKYGVGSVLARLSKGEGEAKKKYRDEALSFLREAWAEGFGIVRVTEDHDLDPIRDDPRFGNLLAAAQILRARSAPARLGKTTP